MKWIGQHIWDFISRFRSDVYLEAIESGTIASGGNLGLDSNNKIVKADTEAGELSITNASDNRVVTSSGGTDLNAEANMTFNGSTLTLNSTSSGMPSIYLLNEHDGASPMQLAFFRTATGEADDNIGQIDFYHDNDNNQNTSFAQILTEIHDVNDGQEAGKMYLKVATAGSGTSALQQAFTATGHGTSNTVNIGLGYGTASVTAIAGTLTMGSTAFVNNSGVVQVATQGTIDHDSLANFVANEHIDWTGDVSASSVIHTNNITDLHGAGVDGSANQLLTDDGDGSVTSEASLTWDGDDMLITSATSQKPVVEIRNTTSDGNGPELKFNNTNAGGDASDGDFAGKITFNAMDDGTPTETTYASIYSRIDDATSTEESGNLYLSVANHDGGLGVGFKLTGGSANDEVDVEIGKGGSSITTIVGDLNPSGRIRRTLKITDGSTAGEYDGDVVYTGTTTGMTAGDVYYYTDSGTWALTNCSTPATSTGLLAVALGSESDVNGMLLRGMVTSGPIAGSPDEGAIVYLRASNGDITTDPASSGQVNRIVGYCMENSNNRIYFDPDKSWVELA
tara:strand:+ start:52 stop:1749 length:1698 start_codon:yes stop_codon:yes gene_type:complete